MLSKWGADTVYNSERQEPDCTWVMSHTTGSVMRLPLNCIVRDHGHAQRLPYKHLTYLTAAGLNRRMSAHTIIKYATPMEDGWHLNRYVCSRIVVVSDGIPSANDGNDGRPRCFWCIRVAFCHGKGHLSGTNFLWPLASCEAWRFYATLLADTDLGNGPNASSLVTQWVPERNAEMEVAIVAGLEQECSASLCNDRLFVAALLPATPSPSPRKTAASHPAPAAALSAKLRNAPADRSLRCSKASVRRLASRSDGTGVDHMASLSDDLHSYVLQFVVGGRDDGWAPLAPSTYVRAVDWRTRLFVRARIASWMNTTERLCKAVACTNNLTYAYALRKHITQPTLLSVHACFFACLAVATAKQVRHVTDQELEGVYEHLQRNAENLVCAPVHLNVLTGLHSERKRLNPGKELMTISRRAADASHAGTGMDTGGRAYRTRQVALADASWVPEVRLNLWVDEARVHESQRRGWRMWP